MNISALTNQYSISKTLRFSLIPQGATEKNIELYRILESDNRRAEKYVEVKKLLDEYHKAYIENRLADFEFDSAVFEKYVMGYDAADQPEIVDTAAESMMKAISDCLQGNGDKTLSAAYSSLFSKDMMRNILPDYLKGREKDLDAANEFKDFWTFFVGYNQNRENMYTGEGKSTEIAYRVVKQNLPKFLDNIKAWKIIKKALSPEEIEKADREIGTVLHVTSDELFTVKYYNKLVTQSGIDTFNQYLGGYTTKDTKLQGINEIINLHVQQTGERIPRLKPLFKQILSDRESISFIPEAFATDQEVLDAVSKYCEDAMPNIAGMHGLLQTLEQMEADHVYVAANGSLTALSNTLYGSWCAISEELKQSEEFGRNYKTYKSFSLCQIDTCLQASDKDEKLPAVISEYMAKEKLYYDTVQEAYKDAAELISGQYPSEKTLIKDDDSISLIKNLLDAMKEYQRLAQLLSGSGEEAVKDGVFYGQYAEYFGVIDEIDKLYDKVRNYATQKPFSTDKIRVMFDKSDFLSGWAQPDEWQKQEAHLFERNGRYYLFVTSRTLKTHDVEKALAANVEEAPATCFEYYFQKPDNKNLPRLFIRSKKEKNEEDGKKTKKPSGDGYAPAVKEYDLPIGDIIDIYDAGYFKTEWRKKDEALYKKSLVKMIDYFKLGLSRHKSYRDFEFDWKPSEEYADISEFYRDTANSCYLIKKTIVNYNALLSMTENGNGYLFEIYSKDFSQYSHGRPNLHTLYFKALFDDQYSGLVRLQGGAAVFFRKASLKREDTAIHQPNVPLKNKNELNPKQYSEFAYELVKDKRYTVDHFELHMPLALNFNAPFTAGNVRINDTVRNELAKAEDIHVIGIDRGERNLLYVSVIDGNGRIEEQFSLNVIEDSEGDTVKRTDYHKLLDTREKERLAERREWRAIDKIKDIKEGYLSQAIHKIAMLIEKYNAVIALENLNSGFKNIRSAVEKSVYQKFEKMLCDKLSYMVDKQKQPTEPGGYMKGYQLAEPVTSYNDMRGQNGIIFYIPAWMTSKIDPTTGFADLLHPRYENVEKAREFLNCFTSVSYNAAEDVFEFETDMRNFPKTDAFFRKNWKICTNGERIRSFRSADGNGEWKQEMVKLTEEFKALFERYGIDYRCGNLRASLTAQTEKNFYVCLLGLLALTLQMRNSITGTDVDYLISPVRGSDGTFYDSRTADASLPCDADANGAYNIARKGLWVIRSVRKQMAEGTIPLSLAMKEEQWFEYAQSHE